MTASARNGCSRHPPPRVPSAEDAVPPEPPLPEAILEIYQDYNAGPADGVDREQPDFRADLYVNGHSNGYVNGREPETETVDTALDRASDALIAAGWEQVDEYYSKDFRHFYFKPPADQAWRPSRRLFNLNDPNQTAS